MPIIPVQVVRQLLLTRFAADLPTPDRVGEETPAQFTGRLPFVQVRNLGGTRDLTIHRPRIVITTWAGFDKTSAAGRGAAADLAGRIDDFLTCQTPTVVGLVVVGISGTTQSPAWTPYDDENVTRYVATYRFSMHQARSIGT